MGGDSPLGGALSTRVCVRQAGQAGQAAGAAAAAGARQAGRRGSSRGRPGRPQGEQQQQQGQARQAAGDTRAAGQAGPQGERQRQAGQAAGAAAAAGAGQAGRRGCDSGRQARLQNSRRGLQSTGHPICCTGPALSLCSRAHMYPQHGTHQRHMQTGATGPGHVQVTCPCLNQQAGLHCLVACGRLVPGIDCLTMLADCPCLRDSSQWLAAGGAGLGKPAPQETCQLALAAGCEHQGHCTRLENATHTLPSRRH